MVRERLQKILASAGVASRRQAEAIISSGDVTVNGRCAVLGDSADVATDVILVRGIQIREPGRVYLAINKPAGVVTTMRGTHGEPTVADLIPDDARLFPVGRLDRDTTGLLLLTNDGEWANLVAHPRYRIEKEYLARVAGNPSSAVLEHLRRGVTLPDGSMTAPAEVDHVSTRTGATRLRIIVREGKKRQIRLMLAAVGYPALALKRVRIGPIQLGSLAAGANRELTTREVESIREMGRGLGSTGARPDAPGGRRRTGRRG